MSDESKPEILPCSPDTSLSATAISVPATDASMLAPDPGRRWFSSLLAVIGGGALASACSDAETNGIGQIAQAATGTATMASGSDGAIVWTDTLAELRAVNGTTSEVAIGIVAGAASSGDGGGGIFRWLTGTAPTDDNGIRIVPSSQSPNPGYWLRLYSGAVNVLWFGAKRDGSSASASANNTAFSAALDAAAATLGGMAFHSLVTSATGFAHGEVFVPRGHYVLSTVLDVPGNITIVGEGTFASTLVCTPPGSDAGVSLANGWIRFTGQTTGRGGGLRNLMLVWDQATDGPMLVHIDGRGEVRLEGLLIVSNYPGTSSTGTTTLGVRVNSVTGFVMRDCRLQYCGVQLAGTMSTALLDKVYVNGGYGAGVSKGLEVPAFDLTGLHIRLTDCVVEYVGQHVADTMTEQKLGAITVRSGNGSIVGCYFEGCGGWCIDLGTDRQTVSYNNAHYWIERCVFGGNPGALGVNVGYARGGGVVDCSFDAFRYYGGENPRCVQLRTLQSGETTVGNSGPYNSHNFTVANNYRGNIVPQDSSGTLPGYPGTLSVEDSNSARSPCATGQVRFGLGGSSVKLHLSAEVTITWSGISLPATLTPGSVATGTGTFTGATVTDVVTAALTSNPVTGVIVHAAVVGADQIGVTVVNHSSSNYTLSSGSVIANLWRH